MPAILHHFPRLDPSESTIGVRLNPSTLSDHTLTVLLEASESRGIGSDTVRGWLRERVLQELGRRAADDDERDVPLECEGWALPWHQWTDDDLAGALGYTCSLLACKFDDDTKACIIALHTAVVIVCCTRLRELHQAIEHSRRREQTS